MVSPPLRIILNGLDREALQLEEYIRDRLSPSDQYRAPVLMRYIELIERYARTLNLTGITGSLELADHLALEALRLLELGDFPHGAAVADLGSGNGSPVVPLAICCPGVRFSAIEARQRRVAFIATCRAALDLENLEVLPYRVEDVILEHPAGFDCVISRAFAKPPLMLGLARQLLKPTGEVRGFAGADIAEAEQAAQLLGYGGFAALRYAAGGGTRHVWRASLVGYPVKGVLDD